MSSRKEKQWADALSLHAEAVSRFAEAAAAVPGDSWEVERDSGKWTPALVVEHVTLAYEILLQELRGGKGMALRLPFWQRWILRFTMVPRILRGGPFPRGARAPREVRPSTSRSAQPEAVKEFQRLSKEFEECAARAFSVNSKTELTHAYFGAADLPHAVTLCARHILHHAAQISGRARSEDQ